MNRQFVLLHILVATASSLLFVQPAFSSVAKPSVPRFTVKLEAHPYYVPPTYEIDPFTGENTKTKEGYTVENKTIIITIKNQRFTSKKTGNGHVVKLYYCVRTKGHFGNWSDESSANGYVFKRVLASSSDFTVVTLVLGSDIRIPMGGQADFQVKAQAGYEYPSGRNIFELWMAFKTVEESSWSNTQTITIGAPLSTILYATLIVLLGVASLGLAFYLIKRKQKH